VSWTLGIQYAVPEEACSVSPFSTTRSTHRICDTRDQHRPARPVADKRTGHAAIHTPSDESSSAGLSQRRFRGAIHFCMLEAVLAHEYEFLPVSVDTIRQRSCFDGLTCSGVSSIMMVSFLHPTPSILQQSPVKRKRGRRQAKRRRRSMSTKKLYRVTKQLQPSPSSASRASTADAAVAAHGFRMRILPWRTGRPLSCRKKAAHVWSKRQSCCATRPARIRTNFAGMSRICIDGPRATDPHPNAIAADAHPQWTRPLARRARLSCS